MKNLNCNQIKIFINLEIIGEEKCRVTVFRPSPLQWICRECGQKLGCDEATACFGDERHTESSSPIVPGRRDSSLEDGDAPTPLLITQEPPSCFWASLLFFAPPFWVVSVVIYSSLPFILLLHLSIIHAYPQVHVPSAILSSVLWAAVTLIALSKGHIHIKGGQGVSCAYLIRMWQLFMGLPPHLFPYS